MKELRSSMDLIRKTAGKITEAIKEPMKVLQQEQSKETQLEENNPPIAIENPVGVNHAGTILTATPLYYFLECVYLSSPAVLSFFQQIIIIENLHR